jgi:hypothetical protein
MAAVLFQRRRQTGPYRHTVLPSVKLLLDTSQERLLLLLLLLFCHKYGRVYKKSLQLAAARSHI